LSTHNHADERNHIAEDTSERHLWGKLEHVDGGGTVIKVKGNGTEYDEAILLTINGIGMHLPADTDAEVIVFPSGSDKHTLIAIATTPHTKERKWKEGTNGQQSAADPNKALEFNKDRTHLTDVNVTIGRDGAIEVIGGKITVRGDLHVTGKVTAAEVDTPSLKAPPQVAPSALPVTPPLHNDNGTPNDAAVS
jgi:hypothetical protein